MAENLLDYVALTALAEADDFHLTDATGALERFDFVHAFDEHGPSGSVVGRLPICNNAVVG